MTDDIKERLPHQIRVLKASIEELEVFNTQLQTIADQTADSLVKAVERIEELEAALRAIMTEFGGTTAYGSNHKISINARAVLGEDE